MTIFLGSKTFLLGLGLDEILISFFYKITKNDQFLLKMEPKEPSPTHPNRTEHKQEPPTRSRGRPRLPTEQKEQPATSNIVPPFKNYLLQKKSLTKLAGPTSFCGKKMDFDKFY